MEIVLSKCGVSADILYEAFEAWGIVAESALVPSPTQDPAGEELQPTITDQGQSSETVAITTDPVSPLVPRTHTRCIKPKRAIVIAPPRPPPPPEQENVEMTKMSQFRLLSQPVRARQVRMPKRWISSKLTLTPCL